MAHKLRAAPQQDHRGPYRMRQGPGPGLFTPHCTPAPCGSAFPAHCMSPPKEDRKELGTLSPEGLISSSGPREASWEHGSWVAAHRSLVTAAGKPTAVQPAGLPSASARRALETPWWGQQWGKVPSFMGRARKQGSQKVKHSPTSGYFKRNWV